MTGRSLPIQRDETDIAASGYAVKATAGRRSSDVNGTDSDVNGTDVDSRQEWPR